MRKLVITVHGIRTFGQWQERLERLVRAKVTDVNFENYHYGYFSVISFIIPVFRWLATRSFRNHLLKLIEKYPDAEISIVSHSFGTHLVGWGLLGMAPDIRPRIRNVILAGSVLKSGFPWSTLLDSNAVGRVINDCGIEDNILILSQFFVLFTGMAGRLAFTGMTGMRFVNRFFSGGHSHYFERHGKHSDHFMARYWVPLITEYGEVERVDERKTPGVMQGVKTTILQIADPVKLLVYVGAFWWPLNTFVLTPLRTAALETKLARSEMEKEQLKTLVAIGEAKDARAGKDLAESQARTADANAALNEIKARNARATAEVEKQLLSDARSKIDSVRTTVFDEKVLFPSLQLAVLSKLEWLAGEFIQTDFDKVIINSEGKSFLDSYVQVLGKAGFKGNIDVQARVGRYCLSRSDEFKQADPEVDIAQCARGGLTKAYAKKLSEKRARAVVEYLVGKGFPATKINWEGLGDRPVFPYPMEGLAVDWNRVARLNSRIDISVSVGP